MERNCVVRMNLLDSLSTSCRNRGKSSGKKERADDHHG
jgi:hypothetical protein